VAKAEITKGRIRAISVSSEKGTPKINVAMADLKADFGIVGDAHAGNWPRQISLLAAESIQRMTAQGLKVTPGDFGENLTTEGVETSVLRVGCKLRIGEDVEIEITQVGKRCHGRCGVYRRVGDCIMPREGLFAKVNKSGRVKTGDVVEIVDAQSGNTDGQ
jgi:molybdopterin adenylyltransferase